MNWIMSAPSVQSVAIYLCHNAGMRASELEGFFAIKKRQINRSIAAFRTVFTQFACGVDKFNDVMEQWSATHVDEDVDDRGDTNYEMVSENLEISSPISLDFRTHSAIREKASQESKYRALKRRLKKALLQNAKLKFMLRRAECCDRIEPEAHEIEKTGTILDELMELRDRHPNGRRYSAAMFRFAYTFMTYSPRAFRYVRNFLPLPSRSQIYDRFHLVVSDMKKALTDIDHAHLLIEGFLKHHGTDTQKTVCTLAIDAFAFRLFLRKTASIAKLKRELTVKQLQRLSPVLEDKELLRILIEDFEEHEDDLDRELVFEDEKDSIDGLFESYTSCFIYVLIPLNSDLPSVTLHLMPAHSGAANEAVRQKAQQLIDLCSLYNIDIAYISADGDSGWNNKFTEMFKVMQSLRYGPLDDFSIKVYNDCRAQEIPLAVTDLLHYLKAARGRYIDKKVVIMSSNLDVTTNPQLVDHILGISMIISDKSQLGRMRDFYPIQLFTIRNIRILLDKKLYADAFYFLPHALLLVAIRVPFLSHRFRMQLLSVVYSLMYDIYLDVTKGFPEEAKKGHTKVNQRRSESETITWGEVATLRRLLCSIVAYASSFQLHSDNLRTDALGTHIVEGKIGQARQDCDTRWQRILSTVAQASLRGVFQDTDEVSVSVPGRLKTAGCCFSGDSGWEIEEFDDALFSQVMFHSISPAGRVASDFKVNFKKVKKWVCRLESVISERDSEIGKVWLPNPAANSAIMARLLTSCEGTYGIQKKQNE